MGIEAKGIWEEWEPMPQLVGKDKGELFVRVFLPYSDLLWANPKKFERDSEAIQRGEIPPSFFETDEDYLEKDDNGNLMPGNITEDIYWAVHHTLPFWRLSHIKQLALLTHSTEDELNYYAKGGGFHQTRDNHSFLVARPLEAMLRINNFPQQTINNGIIAGLTHDIATPPFGDPTKEIDPEILNEEAAIRRLFAKYDLSPLAQFGFDKQTVLDAIEGKGTLGKLLDIADKISYTAIDVHHFVGDVLHDFNLYNNFFNPNEPSPDLLGKTINPMKELITADPKWANIYQDVRVDGNGEPFFTNAHRLATFLELRARMHKGLYLNPHCRAQDMLYKMLTAPLYSRDPNPDFPLNSENLLWLTDYELNHIILNTWPFLEGQYSLSLVLGLLPNYIKVKDPKQIEEIVRKLQEQGALVIGSETIRRFNPATDFRARDPKDGTIKKFAEIFPQKAQEIDTMVDDCNQTVVYFWPQSNDPDSLEVKLKPTIAQIIEDAKQRNGGKLPSYSLY